MKLISQTSHLQLNLFDSFYGKDISGNAVLNVSQIFQEGVRLKNAPAKQAFGLVVSCHVCGNSFKM